MKLGGKLLLDGSGVSFPNSCRFLNLSDNLLIFLSGVAAFSGFTYLFLMSVSVSCIVDAGETILDPPLVLCKMISSVFNVKGLEIKFVFSISVKLFFL